MKCANWILRGPALRPTLSCMWTVKGTRFQHLSGAGVLVLALGLVTGCEGGQTGDLSGQNGTGNETGSEGCDEHRQKLASFDETTDAGSANQLLAFAERTFDAPLTWKAPPAGQAWSVGPESGSGSIHVSVTRGQSAYLLSYTPHESNGSGSGAGVENVGVICPPTRLAVEARVDVTTDGGALDESYDALIRSRTAGVAQLSVPFDPTRVSGTLQISSSNPQAKLVQLQLAATLTTEGMTGSLAGLEQVTHGSGPDSAVSASSAVLAVWPDSAACQARGRDGGGLGVAIEAEALGSTGEATLASLVPSQPVPISWLDGSDTTLTIGLEATGDGCLRVEQDFPTESGSGVSVSYPVTISLRSADGRLDGTYQGSVVASGTGPDRAVIAEAVLPLSLSAVDESGFSSVQVPADADSLLLRLEETLEGGRLAGVLRLIALTDPDCPPPSSTPSPSGSGQGSPGCPGQTQTPLETASWSQ